MIVVTDINTRFLASAGSGEDLIVETEVVEVRRVTTRWRQRLLRGDEVLAVQELGAAVTNLAGRPVRFPVELVAALEPFLTEP
jgi:acyl-CoA thioesterase FadM